MSVRQDGAIQEKEQAILAIKQLYSPNRKERQSAKGRLILMGKAAEPPLLDAFKDIADNQDNVVLIPTSTPEEEEERIEQKLALEAEARVVVYELVGRLHIDEAVHLLIRIMERYEPDDLLGKRSPELIALAQIGLAAVPAVIESIQNAAATAAKVVDGFPVKAYAIRIRGAVVLGEIGDARGLPIVQRLLEEYDDIAYWKAVQQIKKKNGMEYDKAIDPRDPDL